jgi:hypothetical protein
MGYLNINGRPQDITLKNTVEEFWQRESHDMGRLMARIKELEYDPLPHPKQPEQACLANLGARVKSILDFLSKKKEA